MVIAQQGKREISEAEAFFFEKSGSQVATARIKKLLSIAAGTEFKPANSVLSETDKSFLILAVATCDPLFSKRSASFPYPRQ